MVMPEMEWPHASLWDVMTEAQRLRWSMEAVIEARRRAIVQTQGPPVTGPSVNEKTALTLLTNALRDAGYEYTFRPNTSLEWRRVNQHGGEG